MTHTPFLRAFIHPQTQTVRIELKNEGVFQLPNPGGRRYSPHSMLRQVAAKQQADLQHWEKVNDK